MLRVFTYGSPPVATLIDHDRIIDDGQSCPILKSLDLRPDIVYGYAQPWVSDGIFFLFYFLDTILHHRNANVHTFSKKKTNNKLQN